MLIPRLTLDTNCLINLENNTSEHASVRALINAHRARRLVVCVPAMVASENQRGGQRIASYTEFKAWLHKLVADDCEEVLPMAYWGVVFWGHAIFPDDESRREERAIHDVVHPNITFDYAKYCAERGLDPSAMPLDPTWLNAKCDVQLMWSHIHAKNSVFVTEDRYFLSADRRLKLTALGAGDIMTPNVAAATFLSATVSP